MHANLLTSSLEDLRLEFSVQLGLAEVPQLLGDELPPVQTIGGAKAVPHFALATLGQAPEEGQSVSDIALVLQESPKQLCKSAEKSLRPSDRRTCT